MGKLLVLLLGGVIVFNLGGTDDKQTIPEKEGKRIAESIRRCFEGEDKTQGKAITDNKPRNIIGIEKIEERKKSILRTIDRLTNISKTSIFLRDIPLKNKIDDICNCFFIFVPQTKDFISVKKQDHSFSFPLRVGSEIQKTDDKILRDMKKNVYKNNFNYLYTLKEFSES